jgi:hypothetical protein
LLVIEGGRAVVSCKERKGEALKCSPVHARRSRTRICVRWWEGTGHRSSPLNPSPLRAPSIPRRSRRDLDLTPSTTFQHPMRERESGRALPLHDRLLHCLPIQLRVLGRRWPLRQGVAHPDPDDCISLGEMARTSSTASLPHSASMPHSSYGAPMGGDRSGFARRGRSRTGKHEHAAVLCWQPQLR